MHAVAQHAVLDLVRPHILLHGHVAIVLLSFSIAGSEGSVDKLLKQISSLMSDITFYKYRTAVRDITRCHIHAM
jgi:ACT domain-containing protein